jgi:hypothetical protein
MNRFGIAYHLQDGPVTEEYRNRIKLQVLPLKREILKISLMQLLFDDKQAMSPKAVALQERKARLEIRLSQVGN